jgi:hypothetical protein
LERVEVGSLGVEVVWNGGGLGGEILMLGAELGLDRLKWGVGVGLGVEGRETVWNGHGCEGLLPADVWVRGCLTRKVGERAPIAGE